MITQGPPLFHQNTLGVSFQGLLHTLSRGMCSPFAGWQEALDGTVVDPADSSVLQHTKLETGQHSCRLVTHLDLQRAYEGRLHTVDQNNKAT